MSTDALKPTRHPAAPTDWRSRNAAWLPWAVVAALAVLLVGTVVLTDNNPEEPPYPHDQLDGAIGMWVFTYVFPVVWAGLLIFFICQLIKTKTFSMPALLFIAGTTMFWIEWPADWGAYLVYNRDFAMFPGWTSTWYQTYHKPIAVIFGYGVFFAVECVILLKVVPPLSAMVQRLIPALKSTGALIVSCMLVFYMVDICGERLMTWLGWYSYAEPVGPAWESARGTISFVWPAIPFLIFAIAITLTLRADERGDYPSERFFRVNTLRPGLTREFARLAVWITTMNVAIFIAQPLILVLGRILFFHDSVYNP